MKRTVKQNDSIHKYCELLAYELNYSGQDMKKVITADIPWTKETVKQHLWKTVQEKYIGKKSTADLDTKEVGKVYEILSKVMAENFGVYVRFPSEEEVEEYGQSL